MPRSGKAATGCRRSTDAKARAPIIIRPFVRLGRARAWTNRGWWAPPYLLSFDDGTDSWMDRSSFSPSVLVTDVGPSVGFDCYRSETCGPGRSSVDSSPTWLSACMLSCLNRLPRAGQEISSIYHSRLFVSCYCTLSLESRSSLYAPTRKQITAGRGKKF